ncbi:MAG TPA: hypothetical protein VGE07_17750 [Herpetosiphonaceae bacterium]
MRHESLSTMLDELRESGYRITQTGADCWIVAHDHMAGTPLGDGMPCSLDDLGMLLEIQRAGLSQAERMLITEAGDLLRRRDHALAMLQRLDVTVKPLGEGRWQISDPDGYTAHFADGGVADIRTIIHLADAVEDRYLEMLKHQIVLKMHQLQLAQGR